MPDTIPTRKRTGILFRAGTYGNKGTYTDADIDGMCGEVNAPIKMSHGATLLDGKLGVCERAFVGFDDKGAKVLMGEWSEPEPLALLLGDTPRSLSVEIGLSDKKLHAVALEVNPHIKDAAFFSAQVEQAFASFSAGKEIAEFRYESEAERDAIPDEDFGDPAAKLFPVRTQAELRSALEELCNAEDPTAVKTRIYEIAERKGLKIETPYWYSSGGMSKPLGTNDLACYSQEQSMSQEVAAKPAEEKVEPTLAEKVKAWFSGAKPEEIAEVEDAAIFARTGKTKEVIALEEKLAKFERSEEQKAIDKVAEDSKAEFNKLVEAKKATPGQEEQFTAAFTAAILADANADSRKGVACFSAESKTAGFSLTDFLRATLEGATPSKATEEVVGGLQKGQVAAFGQGVTTVTDENTGETLKVVEGIQKAQNDEIRARFGVKSEAN